MSEFDEGDIQLKLIVSKLEILRNFLVVADEGARQQQSAMHDEVLSVMKEVRTSINAWIKGHT